MWTKQFWKATAERAIKTFAQSGVAYLAAGITGLFQVEWVQFGSVAGLAAVISVLTSIGSGAITDGSPSLTSEHLDGKHAA